VKEKSVHKSLRIHDTWIFPKRHVTEMREQNIGVTFKEAKIRSILCFVMNYEILILTLTLFVNNLAFLFDIKKASDTA